MPIIAKPDWVKNGARLEYNEELRARETRDDAPAEEQHRWQLIVLKLDNAFVLEVDRFTTSTGTETDPSDHEQFECRLSADGCRPETDNEKVQWMLGNFPFETGDAVRVEGLPGSYTIVDDTIEIAGMERECWYLKRLPSRFTPKDTSTEFWFDKKLGILLNFVEITPKGFSTIELVDLEL